MLCLGIENMFGIVVLGVILWFIDEVILFKFVLMFEGFCICLMVVLKEVFFGIVFNVNLVFSLLMMINFLVFDVSFKVLLDLFDVVLICVSGGFVCGVFKV